MVPGGPSSHTGNIIKSPLECCIYNIGFAPGCGSDRESHCCARTHTLAHNPSVEHSPATQTHTHDCARAQQRLHRHDTIPFLLLLFFFFLYFFPVRLSVFVEAGHKTHRPCPGAAVLCAAFSGVLASQNINGLMRRGLFLMCRNIDSLGGTRRVKRLCEEITTPPNGPPAGTEHAQ